MLDTGHYITVYGIALHYVPHNKKFLDIKILP